MVDNVESMELERSGRRGGGVGGISPVDGLVGGVGLASDDIGSVGDDIGIVDGGIGVVDDLVEN